LGLFVFPRAFTNSPGVEVLAPLPYASGKADDKPILKRLKNERVAQVTLFCFLSV